MTKNYFRYKSIEKFLEQDTEGIKYAQNEEFMKTFPFAEARKVLMNDPEI